ncbi:MAG: hypothetical protein C5B51_09245 [Terriglobia bacterium]|nr:MAG: hypothetical protein C5B51_09245 [Terriglobia bacterium]
MRKLAIITALSIVIPLALSAARLTLRDGSVVYGNFISGSPQEIVFQDEHGVRRRFDTNRVQGLDFDSVNTPARTYPNNEYDRYNNNNAYRREDSRYGAAFAMLPAGTEVAVRTNEDINAQTTVEGRTYSATINRDVMDENGRLAVPRGSDSRLVIRSVNEGGTLSGGSLVLDLESVQVNGRRYAVSTADVTRNGAQGIGKNRRTGELVGGGAALGTVIGAIAGGGKGALLGALAGAVGGGAVQVLTKGKEIRVPAETELTFRLDQPLQLNEMR